MAADSQRHEAQSNDLFGRWLAHHNEQQSGEAGEQTESAAGTSETPSASRRLPTAAVASSALERDPMIGSRITPPSTFGVRKSAANAEKSGLGSELDRESPLGWEPIVMRSVRKKTEKTEKKQAPKPVDTRSRLQRLKARLVDSPPPAPELELETPLVPLTPPVARSVPLPVPTPKPALPTRASAPSTPDAPAAPAGQPGPAARSLEETIRAAVPTVERPVARHSEPRDEDKPAERTVEQPVEAPVGRHAAPLQAQQAARPVESEAVATPRPVRAFIDAAPVTQPEPMPVFEPEPVAESVVAEAEPDPLAFGPSDGFSFLSKPVPVRTEPEPVAFAEPASVVEPLVVEPVVVEPVVVEPVVVEPVVVEPVVEAVEVEPVVVEPVVVEPVVEAVEVEPVVEAPVVAPAPLVEATIDVEPTEPAGPTALAEPTEDKPAKRSFLSLPKRQPKEQEPEPVVGSVLVAEQEPVVIAEPTPVIEPPIIEPVIAPAPVVAAAIDVEDEVEVEVEPTEVAEVTEVEPIDVEVEATEVTEDKPAKRFVLALPKREPKDPKPPKAGREDRPRTGDAARDLVAAAKARALATRQTTPPAPVAGPVDEPVAESVAQPAVQSASVAVAAQPEPEVEHAKVSKHDEVATEMPGVYKFAAKRTSRRLLTISLLIGIVVSAYFIRTAVQVKETPAIGLAAIVVLATVMVWAIRSGASITTLEVHQGQLQVIQQGGRFIFDLSSQYTRFEVHGHPGHHGWKVLFPRRGMAPFKVDASMVDADDFMRVLRFFRPQLVHH